jgi:hypothetical protein
MPLIQHASNVGRLDFRMHHCLEDFIHSRFPYGFGSKNGTREFPDFPELGDLPVDKAIVAFWQHWSRKGGEFAREHAAKAYAEWKRRSKEEGNNFSDVAKNRLFAEMTRGGIASLPYIMERIEQGDGSLIPYVPQLVRPVRGKQPEKGPGPALSGKATRSQCIAWWRDNHSKYEMSFRTDAEPDTKASGTKPESPE